MALVMGGISNLFGSSANQSEGFASEGKRDYQDNNPDINITNIGIGGGSGGSMTSTWLYVLQSQNVPAAKVRNNVVFLAMVNCTGQFYANTNCIFEAWVYVDGVVHPSSPTYVVGNWTNSWAAGSQTTRSGITIVFFFTPTDAQKKNGFAVQIVGRFTHNAGIAPWQPYMNTPYSVIIGV